MAAGAIGITESTAAVFPEPTEPLDLAALLAEADLRSPEILALRARLKAAEHVPSQAEALPDPTASVSYTNVTFTHLTLGSDTDSDLTFSWTQDVPYPGKRRLSGDVARAEIDVFGQELEMARLSVRAGVKTAYAELLRLDRTGAILRESRMLLESFRDAARSRYETGHGILENVLKAQTELTKIDSQIALISQERRSVEVSLGALLGRVADVPLGPAIAAPRSEMPDRESLESAARERSPQMLRLRATARKEDSRLSLARKNLRPDFLWGASYSNRGGLDPMVMGSFGVRLPLYHKQKQAEAVLQAKYELEAAERDVDEQEVRLRSEVRDLVARAERAGTLIRLYGEGILPQARSALDSALASYSVGKAEFITLIDDFLTVLNYEIDYEAQRAERVKALAALEPMSGATLVSPGPSEEAAFLSGDSHD